jgi:hypothetical protein
VRERVQKRVQSQTNGGHCVIAQWPPLEMVRTMSIQLLGGMFDRLRINHLALGDYCCANGPQVALSPVTLGRCWDAGGTGRR